MHNRLGPGAESREMSRVDFGLIAPLIAVIVFLGVYPNFVLSRSEKSTVSQLPHFETSKILQAPVRPGFYLYLSRGDQTP
jgi:NADH:ubiquinone oxidoreductase subunit 4 (subunit M)